MEEMTIGIVPAPDLPASNAEAMKDKLAQSLHDITNQEIKWHVAVQISPLTGVAERVSDIMQEAKKLKNRNGWDFAVCLTDLPVFSGKHLVLADTSNDDDVAHISLPAFGGLPTPRRTRKTVVHMIRELYVHRMQKKDPYELDENGIGPINKKSNGGFFKNLKEAFRFSPIRRVSSPEEVGGVGVRFVIHSRLNGWSRVLLGMSVANRPWTIMPSFKGVVALAFASGAYGLIFPTLWKLSFSYNLIRFVSLMIASILAMIVWIVFAHNLWETRNKNTTSRLRPLYNAATVMTLTISILMYYLILFIMFLLAVFIFVPPELFSSQVGQHIIIRDYIKLAWLVTSVATVAGAIGSGLEKTEEVGKITYGYRQYLRYEQSKQDEKKEEEDKYGKSQNND